MAADQQFTFADLKRILVDRVGIRLVGAGGAAAVLDVAAGGWAAAWLFGRRGRATA